MAEPHLDHAGEVSWFVGHGPAPILGPCPHTDCPHTALSDVAWGPDFEHYTLVVCDYDRDGKGCGGQCRGWFAEYPAGDNPPDLPNRRAWNMRRFDAAAEHKTTREERAAEDARREAERAAKRAAPVTERAGR